MDFKELIKQTEIQVAAKNNIIKAIAKNKADVLMEFANDIFEYLLFIDKSNDFRFSSAAYWKKGDETRPLITSCLDKEPNNPYQIKQAKESIEKNASASLCTNGMSYFFSDAKIKFSINDEFVPKVEYSTSYLSTPTKKEFTQKDEFIKSFTEFLIANRKTA